MNTNLSKVIALANADEAQIVVVLNNDSFSIDEEGWGLIAPFGEWPKTRVYREDGVVKEQKFIQVLDNESADALLAKEKSFFRTIKRALVGITIFKGHGDLNDIDPAAVANEKNKIKLGVIDQIRKTSRGIEAHYALDNDGADAVAAGWKYPSAFWYVLPNGQRGDATVVRPFKLISVALTQFPNISGVESLANARPTEPAAKSNSGDSMIEVMPTNPNKKMKELLIGWLAAKGIVLANTANEGEILKAVQEHCSTQSNAVTALGNDKTTLGGKISALETTVSTEKKRADDNAIALGNEQTARKAERKRAASAMADLLIVRGKKTVAERDATIVALENSADFEKDSKALLEAAVSTKTTANQSTESGKVLANEQDAAHVEYDREFKKALANNGQDPIKAHAEVMKLPGLADKLRPKAHAQ